MGSPATGITGDEGDDERGYTITGDGVISPAEPPDTAPMPALPRPGSGPCAGRLDPGYTVVPPWLADLVDWHVWPSKTQHAISARARTNCDHIDWEQIHAACPAMFDTGTPTGAPQPNALWAAGRALAEGGFQLSLDVEIQNNAGRLVLAITAAGFFGTAPDDIWRAASPLLTTCASTLRMPRDDISPGEPAGRAIARAERCIAGTVGPARWFVNDWLHTWWTYEPVPLRTDCPCPAHPGTDLPGPDTARKPSPHHRKETQRTT